MTRPAPGELRRPLWLFRPGQARASAYALPDDERTRALRADAERTERAHPDASPSSSTGRPPTTGARWSRPLSRRMDQPSAGRGRSARRRCRISARSPIRDSPWPTSAPSWPGSARLSRWSPPASRSWSSCSPSPSGSPGDRRVVDALGALVSARTYGRWEPIERALRLKQPLPYGELPAGLGRLSRDHRVACILLVVRP